MTLRGQCAIVTAIGLLVGLVGGVARAAEADRSYGVQPPSSQRSEMPPEGVSAPAWKRIVAQIGQARYDARPAPGERQWLVTNPEQGIEARVSPTGLRVGLRGSAANPESTWGLRLTRFGPAGAARRLAEPELFVRNNRVEYRRPGLTEWYVNDARGLEQGFTIDRRPAGKASCLELVMELSGPLIPFLDKDRDGLMLRNAVGDTVLRYGGLYAHDADGRTLSARLAIGEPEGRPRSLRIEVDVAGSAFPIVVDPLITTEVAKLTASDATAGDFFSSSVSISGDTIVVGAYADDDGGSNSGSAYVFERNAGGADGWDQVAKLTASDAAAEDSFGSSVSISGDTVVVGAPDDDDAGSRSGSAYVFERNKGGADAWDQVAKLTASDAAAADYFGTSVSISGDTIVVGALANSDVGSSPGSAYVFERNGGGADAWDQVAKLTASDPAMSDWFGGSVSISGDTVVVGDDHKVVAGSTPGAAYVFERNRGGADAWDQVAQLIASDAATIFAFGVSVSISGDTVVIGAYTSPSALGSAYVFERNKGGADAWDQVVKLTASDAAAGDAFGFVSISGDTVLVGASRNDDSGSNSGSAYVFERNKGGADAWGEVAKLTASDAAADDRFGNSVSISGDTVVVGAVQDDNAGGVDAGSAYVLTTLRSAWAEIAKPVASDAAASDSFGYSTSISGDTLVVGAYLEDPVGTNSGSAYVFVRNAGGADSWDQIAKLIASDAATNDNFGSSVSVSGDTIVVGADHDDNTGGADAGSAYVFERNRGGADAWDEVAKMTASGATPSDFFGRSVSISVDTIVVGGYGYDVPGSNSGSAYVFERNKGGADAWDQVAQLTASDGITGDTFGWSVSIAEDTIVVGAPGNDDAGADSGSAYVFGRNVGFIDHWGQVNKLTAFDAAAGDNFGHSVSVSGNTTVVAAFADDGVGSNSGSAYVFERNRGGADLWGVVGKLTASDAAADDLFGRSVSIDVDTIVVGAEGNDDAGSGSGSAYVFERNEGGADSWDQVRKLTSSDAAAGDFFGWSVSISGDAIAVGGYQNDDAGSNSGSAYVFNGLDPASDNDGDGVSNATDCAPANGGSWSVPGESRDLRLAHNALSGVTSLTWLAPLVPGGTSVLYDAVRSSTASDFTTSWFCAYSDGLATSATTSNTPASGAVHFYLVRGENDCAPGSAGEDSFGVLRQVHDCP